VPVNLKILRTSTFRLAAIYLLLFALSTATILYYVYYTTVHLLERQTEETIRAEVEGLADQYRIRGMTGILDVVQRRSLEKDASIYILNGPDGSRIAGNLAAFPKGHIKDSSWIDFPITVGEGQSAQEHTVRAFHVELDHEYELLVGRDVQSLRSFGDVIRRSLYWALGLALVMGLGGGLLMSRNFLRRIEAITDASHTIMAGDLSQRMPIGGTGDELDRLSGSLNDMLSQIERLMSGMKDVTSNIAHDLKTPLTRMRARVENALRNNNKAEYRGALDQTIAECDGLLQTFNALLSIAQAEAGQARHNMQELDVSDILNDVVELYEPIAEDAGGSLTMKAAPGLIVYGNRQLLAQAISNLFDNALKYGGSDKPIEILVTAKSDHQSVVVAISDHGAGIPAKDRTRVIDRFVRLDESRSKPGNGLGLSLVSSVMTLHNGKLILEDNKPGLVAILQLPTFKSRTTVDAREQIVPLYS
jgi:signal transduction histidine kinase